jgi:hypothetical protein
VNKEECERETERERDSLWLFCYQEWLSRLVFIHSNKSRSHTRQTERDSERGREILSLLCNQEWL